jgi:16S rRNA (guanine1516-N2)-methyltransferase
LNERSSIPALALLAASVAHEQRAAQLAEHLGLPLMALGTDPVSCEQVQALLIVSDKTLCLQQTGKSAPGPVIVDFGSAGMRHRRKSGSRELLGRAVGLGKKSPLKILDATAGLGGDAFVLADLGCEVVLCEREPVIVELLRAGLQVAAASGDPWLTDIVQRMQLNPGDAQQSAMCRMRGVDVIYLDPMFPATTKTAAVKKEMALFRLLLEQSAAPEDADSLLSWALQQDAARVVVKRPVKAASLGAMEPSHCIRGKSVRYDVYVHRRLS